MLLFYCFWKFTFFVGKINFGFLFFTSMVSFTNFYEYYARLKNLQIYCLIFRFLAFSFVRNVNTASIVSLQIFFFELFVFFFFRSLSFFFSFFSFFSFFLWKNWFNLVKGNRNTILVCLPSIITFWLFLLYHHRHRNFHHHHC